MRLQEEARGRCPELMGVHQQTGASKQEVGHIHSTHVHKKDVIYIHSMHTCTRNSITCSVLVYMHVSA